MIKYASYPMRIRFHSVQQYTVQFCILDCNILGTLLPMCIFCSYPPPPPHTHIEFIFTYQCYDKVLQTNHGTEKKLRTQKSESSEDEQPIHCSKKRCQKLLTVVVWTQLSSQAFTGWKESNSSNNNKTWTFINVLAIM